MIRKETYRIQITEMDQPSGRQSIEDGLHRLQFKQISQ